MSNRKKTSRIEEMDDQEEDEQDAETDEQDQPITETQAYGKSWNRWEKPPRPSRNAAGKSWSLPNRPASSTGRPGNDKSVSHMRRFLAVSRRPVITAMAVVAVPAAPGPVAT